MTHINYQDYDSTKFQSISPIKINFKQITYHEIPLVYKSNNQIGDFILEGCEMKATGIQLNRNSNNVIEYKLFTKFDLQNKNHVH